MVTETAVTELKVILFYICTETKLINPFSPTLFCDSSKNEPTKAFSAILV